MADESQIDPINKKVGILLSYGVEEKDIADHLSKIDDPAHQNWVRQYNLLQVEKQGKEKLGITASSDSTNEDAIKAQQQLISQQNPVGPSLEKLAQIGVVGATGFALGKQIPAAVEYGTKLFGTLKDKMFVPPPPPVDAPTPTAAPATPAPSGIAALQERFNLVPKRELTPEENRQQKLKAAAAAAQQQMIPGAVAPSPVALPTTPDVTPSIPAAAVPDAATPTAVDVVTPVVESAIANDPVASPIEKAQALVNTPETPAAETPKGNRYDVTTPVDSVPPPERIGPLTTASGFPAQEGTGPARKRIPSEVESMEKIPKGMAFVPGMDIGGTNTARNALGQQGAIDLARQRGVPFGTDEETRKVLAEFNAQRSGPPATREFRKAINAPMPSNTPGITGAKVMKVGGVLGTLMAVSDLANAQSLPEARSTAFEIGSGLLPVPLQGAIFSGGTNVGEQAQIDYLRRMQQAKTRGAANRGMAYDPRIPYNPQFMDVGIPPPFNR